MSDKRVAVIGGGLGGLSAAIRLAHAGYSVDLYDQQNMVGGKASGQGVLESWDHGGKDRYTGGFAGSLFDGHGVLDLADGSRYEGGFADGKANGKGVYTDPFDDVFKGTWSDGKADGEFVVTRADGTTEKQLWRSDQQVATGGIGGEQ